MKHTLREVVAQRVGSRVRRGAFLCWLIVSMAMTATTAITSWRAYAATGDTYYLFTRTSVLVERPVEPSDETDSALDALFAEAGEPLTEFVSTPMFVLGLLDATLPASVITGLIALLAGRIGRHREKGGELIQWPASESIETEEGIAR